MWASYKKGYKAYLQLERSLSDNSVEAYMRDLEKLTQYLQVVNQLKSPADIELKDLQNFVRWIAELGMNPASQSRTVSGIRKFFKYCLAESIPSKDPSVLLDTPRLKRRLPDVLSFEE